MLRYGLTIVLCCVTLCIVLGDRVQSQGAVSALPSVNAFAVAPNGGNIDPDVPVYWKLAENYGAIDIEIDPLNPANMYAATVYPEAVGVSRDFGETWTAKEVSAPFANAVEIAVDPVSTNYLYVSLENFEIHRSDDYGETWDRIDDGLPQWHVSALYVHPVTPTLVFGLTQTGLPTQLTLLRSENRGDDWTPLALPTPVGMVNGYQIISHPTQPGRIYTVTNVGVFTSDNAGLTWVDSGLQADYLAIDTQNPNLMYRVDCEVYRSDNGGGSWVLLTTPTPCYNKVYLDPLNSDYVYLLRPSAPTRSLDGGQTWQILDKVFDSGSVPNAATLAFDPTDTTRIFVGPFIYFQLYMDESVKLPLLQR